MHHTRGWPVTASEAPSGGKGFTPGEQPPTMAGDRVECSRCRETFATQDELIVHSIEVHTGDPPAPSATESPGGDADQDGTPAAGGGGLDEQTTAQLLRVLERQSSETGTLQALYGQRFVLVVAATIVVLALALTGLHAVGLIETSVFTFALGTLFGLAVAYLHAFVQSVLQ